MSCFVSSVGTIPYVSCDNSSFRPEDSSHVTFALGRNNGLLGLLSGLQGSEEAKAFFCRAGSLATLACACCAETSRLSDDMFIVELFREELPWRLSSVT